MLTCSDRIAAESAVIMAFIHERPNWPRLTWDSAALDASLGAVRHLQGRLLGRMESLGFQLRSEANVAILTTNITKSSAIEGEFLDVESVRSSVARRLGVDVGGAANASRDVEGVVELMLDATQNFESPLTPERLFNWHALLFRTAPPGKRLAIGAWRTDALGPMQVVSGRIGAERVHFQAPAAARLDREMTQFLDWFNAPGPEDPVLKAGIAHLWFVTIHPFDDGNGRIARAIADMALARADTLSQRFYSMSAQIEAERRDYYDRLEQTQRGDVNITGWLTWFLGCLHRAIESADTLLGGVLRKARVWNRANLGPVNARQRVVLNRLLDDFKGNLTTSRYAKSARCSPDTALRDIRELIDRGILEQNPAGGRSTSYRIAADFG